MKLVVSLHLSIELPDSRFKDFATVGEFNLILDNACAHQFVISKAIDYPWQSLDLSKHKVKIYNSKNLEYNGIGSNVLGDPRIALTWLVNELSQNDITIHKGMIISTGTCSMPLPIQSGDKITADFGDLGSISINTK
jgi:2-keto-4-pentenoate hydratase